MGSAFDVFTPEEIARAAGVPLADVLALLDPERLRRGAETRFLSYDKAVRTGRKARASLAGRAIPRPAELFADIGTPVQIRGMFARGRGKSLSVAASSLVHATLLTIALVMTALNTSPASTEVHAIERTRLVFLATPGPGGGGGGGGAHNKLAVPRVERRGVASLLSTPLVTPAPAAATLREVPVPARPEPSVPLLEARPLMREPEPVPSKVLTAPVATVAADPRNRDGVIARGQGDADSRGAGAQGGDGTGLGTGNGEGDGPGIGPGSGGGTGGGPYRAGSGVSPPRLLREVKAGYTEEARRRGLSGSVVLEIVVRHDGTVGTVKLLDGLGSGLDQRAIESVRQWRFAPAMRRGVPVDVLVEVAVEFTLR